DLRRDPSRPEVSAEIEIARIVVGDPEGDLLPAVLEPLIASGGRDGLLATDWTCEGCEVERSGGLLSIHARDAAGRAYLARSLTPAVYDVVVEMASTSDGTFGVRVGDEMLPAAGEAAIAGDEEFYRYAFQFAIP